MAGNSLGRAVVEFGASTASLQTDATRAVGIVDKAVADINISLNRAGSAANFSGISSQVNSLKSDFASLQGVIGGVFGVTLGAGLLRQIGAMADEWQTANNRILTTVDSSERLASVQRDVFAIAQQTGGAFDDSAKMYQRLEQSIQSSGKSQVDAQREALALTKTLNQEIVVSGASAGEASRSIMDLVHGLSGGVIHAQQLRPIMRQMPDLAKQIADGLGLSAAQFEEMVHKGLPAEAVLKALAAQAGSIEERFDKLPMTFGRAWQQVTNAVERYVGQASQAGAASGVIKSAMIGLANNIDTVATGVETAGIALAAWLGGKAVTTISGLAISLKDAALAQGAYKTAAIASAEADIANAAAQKAAMAATIAQADARNDLRVAEITGLNQTVAALNTEIAALERDVVASNNVLAAHERLIAAKSELTVATTRVAEVESLMAASQAKATLAEQAETAATVELAAAKQRLAVAQAEATSATGLLSRAGAGLFAAIGGWPTVILAAGAALYYVATAESDAEKAADSLNKSLADSINSYGSSRDAAITSAQGKLQHVEALLKEKQALLEQQRAQEEASVSATTFDGALAQVGAASTQTAHEVNVLEEAVRNARQELEFANVAAGVNSTALANWTDGIRGALAQIDELAPGLQKTTEQLNQQAATYGKGHAAVIEYQRDQELAKLSVGATAQQVDLLKQKLDEQYGPTIKAAQALDASVAASKAHTASLRDERKELTAQKSALADYAQDMHAIGNLQDQLESGLRGPYLAALKQYQKGIDLTAKAWGDAFAAGKADKALLDQLVDVQEALGEQYDETNKQIKDQHDLFAQQAQDLSDLQAVQGLSAQQQDLMLSALQKYHDLQRSHYDFYGAYIQDEQQLKAALDSQLPSYIANAQAIRDITDAEKLAQQAAQDYANIWTSAGNSLASTFGKVLVEGGSLFKSLKDIAKQTVEQIITYFAKLAIINPILNAVFGGAMVAGGGSLLPTLANAAVGSGGGSGLSTSGLLGSAANFSSTASGGTQFSILQPASWVAAGKNLWSGFQSAAGYMQGGQYAGSSMFGTWTNGAQFAGDMGPGWAGASTYNPSMLGTGVAVAGGVYAGYNRFQGSNRDFGGALGGVAYGVGTYSAAIGVGAALSGGIAAGLAAVPVVGWIALAAMLVDKISGGKLFGTSGKVIGGESKIDVGAAGANIDQWYTTKGQSAFFGGAYFKEHHTAADQATIDAVNAFFSAIKKGADSFAAEFKLTMSKVASGTFETVFDKNGKQTGTTTTINGQTYKDETQQQFAERLTAESGILTLKSLGLDVTAYTNQFIADADNYAQVVQDVGNAMAYAYQDITRNKLDISGGNGLQGAYDLTMKYQSGSDGLTDTYQRLAQEAADLRDGVKLLTGQDTIASIEAFLRTAQNVGESLAQTYQRLQQASQQYNQFIAQFEPQATYVDDFEASLSNLRKSEQDAIKQANELAKAAGLEGASTDDLIKIHKYAAKQFADLVTQLQASAQSLAFNLGLSNVGTLDEVNAEIERLQGLAGNASSSVNSFGNAMQTASQKATDAINLLLGNLSPLNDQEKLQKALQAQMQGLVAPDAVLEIGRRLYASSSAYNSLFQQVMAIGDRTGKGSSSSGGGSSSSAASFTAADQARLTALLAERDQLQKVAQLQQYQTLAQQIAEIASAKGEDYMQVISDMGINLKDFEKGLGIANDDALKAYIDNIQAQKDSDGQNTASIVDAIDRVAELLQRVLESPKSPVDGPGSGGAVTVGDEGRSTNSGGNGGRNISDGDAEAIGNALYNALQRPGGGRRPAPNLVTP